MELESLSGKEERLLLWGYLICSGQSPNREPPVLLSLQPFLSPSFPLTVLRGMTQPKPVGIFALDLTGDSHQRPLSRRKNSEELNSSMRDHRYE